MAAAGMWNSTLGRSPAHSAPLPSLSAMRCMVRICAAPRCHDWASVSLLTWTLPVSNENIKS